MKFFNGIKAGALLIVLGVLASPASVLAAKAEACKTSFGGFLGFPTWYKYLSPTFDSKTNECKLAFNITGQNSIQDVPRVLLAVFEIILRVGGILAVGIIIYGGILYIISQGEPEKTKNARTTIINALIGLVITMVAVTAVNLIGKNL